MRFIGKAAKPAAQTAGPPYHNATLREIFMARYLAEQDPSNPKCLIMRSFTHRADQLIADAKATRGSEPLTLDDLQEMAPHTLRDALDLLLTEIDYKGSTSNADMGLRFLAQLCARFEECREGNHKGRVRVSAIA
jgi:hypothetical protein